MKKAIAVMAAVAAAAIVTLSAIPASAGASTMGFTSCRTGSPGFVSHLDARGVSCSTARTIEHYWVGHEILTPTVRIAGIRWQYEHRNYPSAMTADTSFNAGMRAVIIVSLPSN